MITYEEFQKVFNAMVVYASNPKNATDIAAPSPQEQARGVSPLDTLPAQWHNWFLNEATKRFNGDADLVGNMVAEVENLLKVCEIEADADSVSQLKEMFSQAYPDKILKTLREDVADIQSKIPSAASAENQLADKNFVNSSVATNTANYIGNFDSVEDLEAYSGTLTNNDYAYVVTTDEAGNVIYNRYKYDEPNKQWKFEYKLNNTGFTAQQMAAINSGITSGMIPEAASSSNQLADKKWVTDNNPSVSSDLNALPESTSTPTDSTYVVMERNTAGAWGRKTLGAVWNWIKNKIGDPVTIEHGGTGKTSAYDAMTNLYQNIGEMYYPNGDEMIMAQRKNNGTCDKYTLTTLLAWIKENIGISGGTTNYIKYEGTTYNTLNVTSSNGVVTFNFS